MNFTYDADKDTCYVHLRDGAVVLQQTLDQVTVTIDEWGLILGLDIHHPGEGPWPMEDLLQRYPFPVAETIFLVTLSTRYLMFRF